MSFDELEGCAASEARVGASVGLSVIGGIGLVRPLGRVVSPALEELAPLTELLEVSPRTEDLGIELLGGENLLLPAANRENPVFSGVLPKAPKEFEDRALPDTGVAGCPKRGSENPLILVKRPAPPMVPGDSVLEDEGAFWTSGAGLDGNLLPGEFSDPLAPLAA